MTVSTQTSRVQYDTNGTTGPWTVPFRFLQNEHLQVVHADSDGVETTLVLDAGYTVTGAGAASGTVATTTAYAGGGTITIVRSVPLTQETDYGENDPFPANTHEMRLDWLTMLAQQLSERADRAISFPVSDEGIVSELPSREERALKMLGYDAQGNIALSVPASGSAADLALQLASDAGADLIGYLRTYQYDVDSVGWAIQMGGPRRNLLEAVTTVSQHAAILAFSPTLDVSAQVQAFLDDLADAGGAIVEVPGMFLCNSGIVVRDKVRLVSFNGGGFKKNSTTTQAVTVVAGSLVVYDGGTLPSNINAVVVLDGTGGRYTGGLYGIRIEGTLSNESDHESHNVEFGIVSIGSVSDITVQDCYIYRVQYAMIFPTIFVSVLMRNRMQDCLRGIGIDNGTSTTIYANYANSSRDWGYYIRDLKYSPIMGNACDSLNRPDYYPDRTRTCAAYKMRSAIGLVVKGNGDEGTWGRNWEFNVFDHSVCEFNVSIRLGSDYVGADEIAVWYSTNVMRGSRLRNNFAYNVKAEGLLSGGASAGQHHNIYFEGTNFLQHTSIGDNLAGAASNSVTESGYGNNTFYEWLTGSATYNPASLADGDGATTTVTVTGAALGDFAQASFSLDLQGVQLTSWVSAANTVSVRFQNESGGVIDLASGTLRARVLKPPL